MKNEWLSISEASKEIGKHPNTVRRMIKDGSLPATKTKEGKYQISKEDIYLFKSENTIKEHTRCLEHSADSITSSIDEEILFSADRLFRRMGNFVDCVNNSDEYKKKKDIIKAIRESSEDIILENEAERMNMLLELETIIQSKQRDILGKLREDIENYFKLYDLKDNIYDFKENIKLENKYILNEIENRKEGIL